MELDKERSRRERLYASKPKALVDSLELTKQTSKEGTQGETMDNRQLHELTTTIKNDITYLQQMKNSSSLPFLM